MARATLEMFLKLSGADKTSRGLDKVSNSSKKLDTDVKNSSKSNAQFAAGMSGLGKAAVAGASIFAARALADFARDSVMAASSAQEAAAAFGTTFGGAAANLTQELQRNAQLFGLTTSEAQQLIGVFGAVAQGMGFTQTESADLSSRLFQLSGDIASFNNISAGAEPVLRAFQSAIVGEREALKTYGIAISEAEVQTKAFEMTGKSSVDALTRQEKALATTELLFQKASVQIGNAEREADGFAAQMLQTRAATAELKEQVGAELLPAAAELLGNFNSFVDTVAPAVIGAFGLVGDAITTTADLTDKGKDAFTEFIARYILGQRVIKDEEGAIEDFNKAVKENNEVLNENSVNIFNAVGFSQDFTNVLSLKEKAFSSLNTEITVNRSFLNINRVAQDKYQTLLNKKTLPTLEKYLKFMNLLNDENEFTEDKAAELASAQDRLAEAQRKEALSTAEEALQKKQLQQEIAELLFFQEKGVNVSEELAVAQEKLKLIEFELTRESEELRDAKAELAEVESSLVDKVDEASDSLANQAEKFLELNEKVEAFKELAANEEFMSIASAADEANPFLALGLGFMSQLAELQGLNDRAQELNKFAAAAERLAAAQAGLFDDVPTSKLKLPKVDPSTLLPDDFIDKGLLDALAGVNNGSVVDGDVLGDQSNVSGNNGGGDTNLNLTLELDGEAIQKFNTKIQQQGKTFLVN
jgi:hypothetical protein